MMQRCLSVVAVTLWSAPAAVLALDIGFDGRLALTASDNVDAANAGSEVAGGFADATFGVFGEQLGSRVQGGFSGEFDNRRQFEGDASGTTITRFLGAVNVDITPRSFSWYTGNILGGVRPDDAFQISDEFATRRRNVFVTGPEFEYDIDTFSRTRARLLYVNQTEDEQQLESLLNASASWERDLSTGSSWGLRFTDIYTRQPRNSDELDFNRVGASVYWSRSRGLFDWYAEGGATRYVTDAESLDGLNATLSATRRLGVNRSMTLALTRDLRDDTLSTVESLLEDGSGEQPEATGFFDETRLELSYGADNGTDSLTVGGGVSDTDSRSSAALAQAGQFGGDADDRFQSFAYASLGRQITSRLRLQLNLSAEWQEYDNRSDDARSLLASGVLLYRLSTSFELEAGYQFDRSLGSRLRDADDGLLIEDVDITENRVTLGVRWAPPTRATRDLTLELKSLLQ